MLRRIGSAVDFADTRGSLGSEDAIIHNEEDHRLQCSCHDITWKFGLRGVEPSAREIDLG